MKIASTHRKGATSALVLAMAALLPGPVFGEVSSAQLAPEVAAPSKTLEIEAETEVVAAATAPVKAEAETRPEILAEGIASYYGAELAGNRTANGERFNPKELTAAHRTLPLGTRLKVTNLANGKSVIVRINDRGPFAKKRIIDVSHAAAERISMVRSGTARVTLEVIS